MSYRIWFCREVLEVMQQWADRHFPNEVGGILVGYEADTGDVVVREVIGPGPSAIHRTTRFLPDSKYQQLLLEQKFEHSGGINNYLGDWHTHPHGICQLSRTDKRTLARIADKKHDCTNTPIMVILAGGVRSNWQIGAHRVVESVWRPWGTRTTIKELATRVF